MQQLEEESQVLILFNWWEQRTGNQGLEFYYQLYCFLLLSGETHFICLSLPIWKENFHFLSKVSLHFIIKAV